MKLLINYLVHKISNFFYMLEYEFLSADFL